MQLQRDKFIDIDLNSSKKEVENLKRFLRRSVITTGLILLLKNPLIDIASIEFHKLIHREGPKTVLYDNGVQSEFYRTKTLNHEEILLRVASFKCFDFYNPDLLTQRMKYVFTSELFQNNKNGSFNLFALYGNIEMSNGKILNITANQTFQPILIEHDKDDMTLVENNDNKGKHYEYKPDSGHELDLVPVDYREYLSEKFLITGENGLEKVEC